MDDFLIEYCRNIKPKDFVIKTAQMSRNKQGKREYLLDNLAKRMVKSLELHFQSQVNIPRIKHGKSQIIETLVNEETLLLAKFLRNELTTWIPRIPML